MKKATKRLADVAEQAVRIRCRYCDLYESCIRRERKEAIEKAGTMTYCAITPNKKKRKKK